MANYLATIDLEDESRSAGVVEKTVQMATGVPNAKIYLMTVIPGITAGIDQRYAIRGEMHGSTDYPLQEWKDEAAKELQEIANKMIPKEMQGGVVVENGTVYREIVEAAKDLDIARHTQADFYFSFLDGVLAITADTHHHILPVCQWQ